MTPTIHCLNEIISALLCFFIASLAWRRYKQSKSGFNLLWAVAFGLTGFEDGLHALFSIAQHDLIKFWVPLTWGVSRFTLAISLLVAVLFAGKKASSITKLAVTIIGVVTVAVWAFPLLSDNFTWVQQDALIKRPIDFALMLIWPVLIIMLWRVPSAHIQVPAGFNLFMILGIFVHGVMALGSREALDGPFALAHWLKVAEYGIWAGAAWWEMRQFSDYSSLLDHKVKDLNPSKDMDILLQVQANLNKIASEGGETP